LKHPRGWNDPYRTRYPPIFKYWIYIQDLTDCKNQSLNKSASDYGPPNLFGIIGASFNHASYMRLALKYSSKIAKISLPAPQLGDNGLSDLSQVPTAEDISMFWMDI
jgi:hypothetical protein